MEIVLRIYLTLPISNATCEIFGALKVKNLLRNTMWQERINSLAMLYIEPEMFTTIDYD